MINVIVVTHGEFGAYLVEAAEWIVGAQKEGVKVISVSSRLSVERLKNILRDSVRKDISEDGIIFMTDMLGGTPTNAVLPFAKDIAKSAVICGININMMVSAFSYRNSLTIDVLVKKILEDGRKSICEVKSMLFSAKQPGGSAEPGSGKKQEASKA